MLLLAPCCMAVQGDQASMVVLSLNIHFLSLLNLENIPLENASLLQEGPPDLRPGALLSQFA